MKISGNKILITGGASGIGFGLTERFIQEGNTVIIFGENPSVNLMAKELNTIPYEILTSISQRVKRVFFRE